MSNEPARAVAAIATMRIIIADKFEKSGIDGLASAGFEIINKPGLKDDALRETIETEKPEGLIVRSTKVRDEMMVDSLKLIVRAGAGYDNIDVAAATSKNIKVANCPGKNAHAVAELAFGLILAIDRRIPENVLELRQGKWNKKGFSAAKGLNGRTIGIVGLGNIGKLVARMAKAFGMDVLARCKHCHIEDAKAAGIELIDSLEEIARKSDIVSAHLALVPETKGSFGESFFQAMKPGAVFINTSRAGVVDQSALEQATREKDIRAGLDVFADEPSTPEGEYSGSLRNNPNIYCTHHIGASTEEAQEAVARETVRIFEEFAKTGKVPNCVNCE